MQTHTNIHKHTNDMSTCIQLSRHKYNWFYFMYFLWLSIIIIERFMLFGSADDDVTTVWESTFVCEVVSSCCVLLLAGRSVRFCEPWQYMRLTRYDRAKRVDALVCMCMFRYGLTTLRETHMRISTIYIYVFCVSVWVWRMIR